MFGLLCCFQSGPFVSCTITTNLCILLLCFCLFLSFSWLSHRCPHVPRSCGHYFRLILFLSFSLDLSYLILSSSHNHQGKHMCPLSHLWKAAYKSQDTPFRMFCLSFSMILRYTMRLDSSSSQTEALISLATVQSNILSIVLLLPR